VVKKKKSISSAKKPVRSARKSRASSQVGRSRPSGNIPKLGERIWQIRRDNRWTLQQVSEMTGVGMSTLSKLENDKIDITFDTLMKLCNGLDLSLHQLVQSHTKRLKEGARTITRKAGGVEINNPQYRYEVLCSEILGKGILPVVITVRAHDIENFDPWNQHPGEEFVYVLEGRMKLYTEIYEPVTLEPGDSAYYDSGMKHAFVSVGKKDAVVLSISHDGTGTAEIQGARLAKIAAAG
jgi:transcriptional regulator with XRE-family HTH domain